MWVAHAEIDGKSAFCVAVRYVVDTPEFIFFFAEDSGLLMRGWKRGGECSPERLFLLLREGCLD